MSCFIYARKSRKDADLEALGIDVLERHITTLLELAKTLLLPIAKSSPATVLIPAR